MMTNQQKFHLKHPNKKKEYQKKYELANKKKIAKRKKLYRKINKTKLQKRANEYRRLKKLNDPLYKLKNSIRRNFNNGFKRNKFSKNSKTENLLGCSFEEFKMHLESKFESWMTWDNYGKYNGKINFGWDIDHIIPLCDAKTENDVIRLNHYSNLQPLCSYKNRIIKKNY